MSLYTTSPAAYKQLSDKDLNFLRLPCVNTLKRYINFTNITTGFNPDILERLALDNDVHNMKEKDRHVALLFDETKIKSNLVYHKLSGKLIGFVEMGDLKEEFSYFNQHSSSNSQSSIDDLPNRELATHVNLYMVRGICSPLIYPFGYFASSGMTANQLYATTMEAIRVLTALNFKVCFPFFTYNKDTFYLNWMKFQKAFFPRKSV